MKVPPTPARIVPDDVFAAAAGSGRLALAR
jgi:hypothetical protein